VYRETPVDQRRQQEPDILDIPARAGRNLREPPASPGHPLQVQAVTAMPPDASPVTVRFAAANASRTARACNLVSGRPRLPPDVAPRGGVDAACVCLHPAHSPCRRQLWPATSYTCPITMNPVEWRTYSRCSPHCDGAAVQVVSLAGSGARTRSARSASNNLIQFHSPVDPPRWLSLPPVTRQNFYGLSARWDDVWNTRRHGTWTN